MSSPGIAPLGTFHCLTLPFLRPTRSSVALSSLSTPPTTIWRGWLSWLECAPRKRSATCKRPSRSRGKPGGYEGFLNRNHGADFAENRTKSRIGHMRPIFCGARTACLPAREWYEPSLRQIPGASGNRGYERNAPNNLASSTRQFAVPSRIWNLGGVVMKFFARKLEPFAG